MSDKRVYKTSFGPIHGQTFTIFMSHNGKSWIMQCDSDTPGVEADSAWERFYAALNAGDWHAWVTLDGAREQIEMAAKEIGAPVPKWEEFNQV